MTRSSPLLVPLASAPVPATALTVDELGAWGRSRPGASEGKTGSWWSAGEVPVDFFADAAGGSRKQTVRGMVALAKALR